MLHLLSLTQRETKGTGCYCADIWTVECDTAADCQMSDEPRVCQSPRTLQQQLLICVCLNAHRAKSIEWCDPVPRWTSINVLLPLRKPVTQTVRGWVGWVG